VSEWLDIIRDHRFFNLLVMNTDSENSTDEFFLSTSCGGITVQYDEVYPITKTSLPNAPDFIAASDTHSRATTDSSAYNIVPHAEEPTPAQRAGNIAFIWGKKIGGAIQPYRDDGLPAVIIAVGLCKHYQYGNLSRTQQHPAIKAQHLAAQWYEKGIAPFRTNGPASLSFEDYKEFWVDGEYKGQKWSDYSATWNATSNNDTLEKFLGNLSGATDMFSDRYFLDLEDEVCYIAEYA
jgi:hypothetical protein